MLTPEAWELLHTLARDPAALGGVSPGKAPPGPALVALAAQWKAWAELVRNGFAVEVRRYDGGQTLHQVTARGRYALAHEADMRRAPAGGAS